MTKKVHGYTLIELVSVMVLIGILAVLAVSRFDNTSYQDRFFSDQLIGALRFSQQLAVASGCDVQVSYVSSTISINQSPTCTGSPYSMAVIDPSSRASNFTLVPPSSITFTATNLPIIFDSMGRARNSNYIVFNTPAQMSIDNDTIYVVGETGYVYYTTS